MDRLQLYLELMMEVEAERENTLSEHDFVDFIQKFRILR